MTRGAAAGLQPESLGCCGVQTEDPTPRRGQERSSRHCLGTQPTASAALAQTLVELWLWRWREGGVGEVKRSWGTVGPRNCSSKDEPMHDAAGHGSLLGENLFTEELSLMRGD